MTKLLIYLRLPQNVRDQYRHGIADQFPDIDITDVDSPDAAREVVADADILLTFGAMMRDDIYANARNLKWVAALGTGVDGVVDMPSLKKDVLVTSTRGIHGVPLSEMAFMMMLGLSRDFPRVVRVQDRAEWTRWPAKLLHGKTLGILGVGLIAEDLAPRCKAFGMEVVGITRTPRDLPGFDRFADRGDLANAVRDLDFLVLLIPYSEETKNIVDAKILGAMKRSAFLVNIARGGVVDEDALVTALNEGTIAGAGLDVFTQEPLPSDHPLWKAKNVIITPHAAGFNVDYPRHALPQFLTSLKHFFAGDYDKMVNREAR